MPVTLIQYLEDDGSVPIQTFLDSLPRKAQAKCAAALARLEQEGHELRRPAAEYIEGTDLYELRVKFQRVNLRILYFFHGQDAVVIAHGFAKERKLPQREIDLDTRRMNKFKENPDLYTYRE